jgi:hypothetical protein
VLYPLSYEGKISGILPELRDFWSYVLLAVLDGRHPNRDPPSHSAENDTQPHKQPGVVPSTFPLLPGGECRDRFYHCKVSPQINQAA